MKKKKTTKNAAGFTFWRKNVKNSILGAFNWAKNTVCETVRKTWEMLLDDNYGVAWGGIVFGALTLLNVLNPWDLLAIISYRPWCETSVVESALALKNVT